MKNLLIISLHADPSMPPGVGEWGGTHTYMRELLTELYDTDYNVILITRKVYPNEETVEQISPYCRILRLTLGTFENFDKRDLYELHEVTFLQVLDKLNELKFIPDIIHSVYWNSGHLAMRLSNLWNIPYVHSVISNGKGRDTGRQHKRLLLKAQALLHIPETQLNNTEGPGESANIYRLPGGHPPHGVGDEGSPHAGSPRKDVKDTAKA